MTNIRGKTKDFHKKTIETMDPEALRRFQEDKFRKQIKYVYETSRFYQEKFKGAGFHPGDSKTVQYLAKVSFTFKDKNRKSQEKDSSLGAHG